MQAAVRDRYGPPEVVEVQEVDRPAPSSNQVLVRVRAASVNRADIDGLYPRWAFVRLFLGLRAPKNRGLGLDVAGVVDAVGEGVTRFVPGDRVFGDLSTSRDGAFAEFVCAPEKVLASIPTGVSFEDAATLPHSAILALQGLRRRDGRTIQPGDTVLIVGASGNVGPFAVQLAKVMGGEVTGVCRTQKMDFVRSLGADHVIDYTTQDETRTGERYDWILDVDAHRSVFRWRGALRPNGAYVTLGGSALTMLVTGLLGPVVSRFGDHSLGMMLWWKPNSAADVATLLELIASGKLRPVIDRTYPLSEIVAALRHVDDGQARGKVVITV
ncbi:MAG: NAD(P)-dependent alcohol dehydrogenase [Chloroflexi bacterium]|nr:NAD(P)-dependent alcohol dehydrogenase [Chloroflexota bacterium]